MVYELFNGYGDLVTTVAILGEDGEPVVIEHNDLLYRPIEFHVHDNQKRATCIPVKRIRCGKGK
jgi:hypothetical protein